MTDDRILVVAAHPDDEVLGCGGTVKRLAEAGSNLEILILGEGITSRYDNRDEADKDSMEALRRQAKKAGKILGAKDVTIEDLPDNRFDSVDFLKIVKLVESKVDQLMPTKIFTHHSGDLNIDHRLTFQAVMTATRPMVGEPTKDIYSFEIPSSTEWSFDRMGPIFSPTVFYDIHRTLPSKLEAISVYKDEMKDYPHPRSGKSLEAQATRWGTVVGFRAAEAFQLIRSVR